MTSKQLPYKLALELKKLGFVGYYDGYYNIFGDYFPNYPIAHSAAMECCAPDWEVVKEWFIDKHNIYIEIRRNPYNKYLVFVEDYIWVVPKSEMKKYDSYQDARYEAFEKAIEVVKNKIVA